MDKTNKKKVLWLWCRDIVIPCLVVYILFFRIFGLVIVIGSSMKPTYNSGEILIMDRLHRGDIQRGDVVVVDAEDSDTGKKLIKRVIGLPGETLNISPDGTVTINGAELQESYIVSPTDPGFTLTYPIAIPEDYIFIMGDNRPNSADSRGPLGLVHIKDVLGVVLGGKK